MPKDKTVDPSEAAMFLWAKSDRGRDDGRWLPLLAHLLDVAACTEAILEREGEKLLRLYADDLQLPLEAVAPWLSALTGLHDIGKAFPGFQLQWKSHGSEQGRQLLEQGGFRWLTSEVEGAQPAHGVVSHYVLQELLPRLEFSKRAARHIADALGAHHGFRVKPSELEVARRKVGTGLWQEVRDWFATQVTTVTQANEYPVPGIKKLRGEGFMRLAGLTSFADWIGSNVEFFPFERSLEDFDAYYVRALEHARQALEQLHWPRLEPKKADFDDIFGFSPRSLQSKTAELLQESQEPTLLLIEAPMGEGKTEAALFAHLLLQDVNHHRGFYIALPTQATGNAMFTRVANFLGGLGLSEPPDLQLVHGAALLDARYADLKIEVGEPWQPEQRVVAREWFTHKKRALLSPHGVGTVDQALLSMLNISHHFVRLWGLANRTVILDEVHAYELYTSTLIERLVMWLKSLNASVILLSATLPHDIRKRLVAAYGGALPDNDKLYPRITRVNSTGVQVEDLVARPLSYELYDAPLDIKPLAKLLRELSEGGGAVGCIVNTVDRAQKLFQTVRDLPGAADVRLFHARFPAQQRKEIEDWAVAYLGEKTSKPRHVILIATQVAEQSLDVDFDVLVSDLAPIDLLIQRAGRLYRHHDPQTFQRPRPTKHDRARLYVSGLARASTLPDISTYYWNKVYASAPLLRTWAALRERNSLQLPDDLDSFLAHVYGKAPLPGELADEFHRALSAAMQDLEAEKSRHEKLALERALPDPAKFLDKPIDDVPFRDDDDPEVSQALRAATRLGDPSVTIIFLHLHNGQLYLDRDGKIPVNLEREPTFAQAKAFLQHAVSLSQRTVFHALAKPTPKYFPKAWERSALLRHARVLELEDGEHPINDKLTLRLDGDLGVVYERFE